MEAKCIHCSYDGPEVDYNGDCYNIEACRQRVGSSLQHAQAEIKRLRAAVESLGDKFCDYADNNPLNETVIELERHRDALEAENRVVRELVEDALDFLHGVNQQAYEGILARCTWLMEEENQQPIDAEEVLRRLGIRIGASRAPGADWCVKVNGRHVCSCAFESTAIENARVLSEVIAERVRAAGRETR